MPRSAAASQCCPAWSSASLREKGPGQVAVVLQRKATNVVLWRALLEAGGCDAFSSKKLIHRTLSVTAPKHSHPWICTVVLEKMGKQRARCDVAAAAGGHGRGGFCSQVLC